MSFLIKFFLVTLMCIPFVRASISAKDDPNSTVENAEKYVRAGFENTYYLGYRDIPALLQKYKIGQKVIDYGCGTGRSTRFLKELGLNPIGVDISKEMLEQALKVDPTSHYLLIDSGHIPVLSESYDCIFCCFVLFAIPNKQELLSIFKEANRCLKSNGIFVIVTGSEELYSHEWLSYNVDYSQNRSLKSGDVARIQLADLGIEFVNYYWLDSDLTSLFQSANLQLIERHFPIGYTDEGRNWKSEIEHPPYVVYVLKKP